ncbi:Clp protease N-terminal domain-containing protein [Actinomadura litoris]|uniref:Clp protease N-terminal domain-containing protein n=1 Tax=Actinomadura litoris TaxID=2678616 RepID=UPI001FA74A34|nr:Clp protease N-terminal domain-containing protein [Actinomadura litoris]
MLERFTKDARQVVTDTQVQARELGHRRVGTEHLLLALLTGGGAAAETLGRHGLDAADLRARIVRAAEEPLDPEALRAIGIDLDAVRQATEETFGAGALDVPAGAGRPRGVLRGHIPFTPEAKKSLELGLRQAIRLKQKHIAPGHLLLGLLHDESFPSARLLVGAGVDLGELRADITGLLTSKAA